MAVVFADTHAIVWFLSASPRLSPNARAAMERAVNERNAILFSAISLVELVYLVEKGRLPAESMNRLTRVLGEKDSPFAVVAVDERVAADLPRIPRDQVPDMPDRIIAASALGAAVPLVTRDKRILSTHVPGLKTIW
jgi:PIN domain nuclease of toxin-antitoxin system